MDNNSSREQWIDAVMGSTNGMEQAHANPYLFQKVRYKLQQGNEKVQALPTIVITRWAVAAALVVAVNILTVLHVTSSTNSAIKHQEATGISQQMGWGNTYNY